MDVHDLEVKLKKLREFIQEGLQVKLTMFIKKPALRKHPLAMHDTTIKVLDLIEGFECKVQPRARTAANRVYVESEAVTRVPSIYYIITLTRRHD